MSGPVASARSTRHVVGAALFGLLAILAGDPLSTSRASAASSRPAVSVRILPDGAPRGRRPVFTEAQIRSFVHEAPESECDAEGVARGLERRYRFLGYVPTIHARCTPDQLEISIRESSYRIDLITFDQGELSRIGVKPDRDYEEKQKLYPVPAGGPRALIRSLLETREGDLYNFQRYRSDRLEASRLGYAIAFIGGVSEDEQATPPGAYLIQSVRPPPAEGAYQRETNYLGATGGYAPRAAGSIGLLYQKDEVFGRFDQLTLSPNYSSALGGGVIYRSPVLAQRDDPRRLYDFEVDLFSNFQHNRDLLGVESDQRRTGIGLSLGIHPLRLPPPGSLRFQIGFRHERLDLSPPPPGQAEENLTLIQLGGTQEWRRTYRSPSLTLRLAPNADLAIDRGGGRRSFVRPSLDATLHNRFLSGLETDLHLLAGTIDRQVPAFEQWSLGGPTTVRGFREDTALGRDLAALQAEIWIPLARRAAAGIDAPETDEAGSLPRFESRAARLIRMALFVDGGSISRTVSGDATSLLGAGLGIRLSVPHQPLVVRLDYGWGLGGHGGRSYPYLSMAYRF